MSIFPRVYLKFRKTGNNLGVASILLCCCTWFTASITAQDTIGSTELEAQDLWQIAEAHFKQDEFASCVQSLQPLGETRIGEIAFDRLWGLCAHGSGEYSLALMAYNRILAHQANNAEIRLERARVLYDLGFYQESREEFLNLLGKTPPPHARVAIVNYLNAIEAKRPKVKQQTRFIASTAIGYDDNVNTASLLEDFLGFAIDPNSQALESPYLSLQVEFKHIQAIKPDMGLKFSAGLSTKQFFDAEVFNQDIAQLGLGYQKLYERSAFGVDLLAFGLGLDSALNAKGVTSNTHYTYQINPQLIIIPYVRTNLLRFSEAVAVKNVNQYALGTKLNYKWDRRRRHSFGLDYRYGQDNPVNKTSNYALDFHRLNFDYFFKLNDSMKITSGLEYTIFDYEAAFFPLAFPEPRNDDSWTLSSRFDWEFNERLTISPVFSYRDFTSNVDIYSYERALIELNFSYQWAW